MRRLAALLLLLAGSAQAQPGPTAEPVRADSLAEVTVTAARVPLSTHRAPSRVTVLGRDAIDATGGTSAADVLEDRSAVFLKRYGPDGLASFSLRGSGASHTLVLLDGHRLSDPQLGQLDPTLLPAVLLERAEVLHGPASGLYGTDAVGGVVSLRTPGAARPEVRVRAGTGAFGERAVSGLVATPILGTPLALSVAGDFTDSAGDYRYVDSTAFNPETGTSGVVRERENSDVARRAGFARLGLDAGAHRGALAVLVTDAERGLFDFAAAQAARQSDRATRVWADHAVRLGAVRVVSGGAWQRAALRYANPSLGLDNEGRTRIATVHTRAERTWTIGGGAWTGTVGGQLGDGMAGHPNLSERAHERTTAAFTALTADHDRWLVSASLRFDRAAAASADSAGAMQAVSPRLGVNVQPTRWKGLRAKASVGRAFRTPTFNDRFWQPGGNPALRPEAGWTAEGALSLQATSRSFRASAEATAFASRLRDQIVWRFGTFADGSYWAPVNVGRTETVGSELSASLQWTRGPASAELGGLWTRAATRDRSNPESSSFGQPLLYVPDDQAKGWLALGWRSLRAGLHLRHAGRRFTRSDGGASLPPYTIADAQVSASASGLGWSARLGLRLDNLTDARYSVVPRFPMPPRHLRATLTLSLL
ncbi:MAG: TonB-dependent receptor [Bacteroidota bacterium]